MFRKAKVGYIPKTERGDPKRGYCPCGGRAVAWLAGSWVCEQCRQIEQVYLDSMTVEQEQKKLIEGRAQWRTPEPYRVNLPGGRSLQ